MGKLRGGLGRSEMAAERQEHFQTEGNHQNDHRNMLLDFGTGRVFLALQEVLQWRSSSPGWVQVPRPSRGPSHSKTPPPRPLCSLTGMRDSSMAYFCDETGVILMVVMCLYRMGSTLDNNTKSYIEDPFQVQETPVGFRVWDIDAFRVHIPTSRRWAFIEFWCIIKEKYAQLSEKLLKYSSPYNCLSECVLSP